MDNNVTLFIHERFGTIRVIMKDGEPWFVAKDVCDALGTATNHIPEYLDDDERGIRITETPSGNQPMTIISEPGLYSLVLRSRKPEAKEFKRWVTHKILPSLRKTGSYSCGGITLPDFTDPVASARAWAEQYEEKLKAQKESEENRKALALTSEALAITSKALDNTTSAKAEAIETAEQAYQHQHELDDRRAATAMGRCGGYVKSRNDWMTKAEKAQVECESLKDELGNGKTWKTVKAIPWLKDAFKKEAFTGNRLYKALGYVLSRISAMLGKDKKKIEDFEYGSVNCYHIDVIDYAEQNLLDYCYDQYGKWEKTIIALAEPEFWEDEDEICSLN